MSLFPLTEPPDVATFPRRSAVRRASASPRGRAIRHPSPHHSGRAPGSRRQTLVFTGRKTHRDRSGEPWWQWDLSDCASRGCGTRSPANNSSSLRGHTDGVEKPHCSQRTPRRCSRHPMTERARVWDATTGKELHRPEGVHGARSAGLALFSPDGKFVLTVSLDWTVRIWDAGTGKERTVLEGHRNGTLAAAFSPDGKLSRHRRGRDNAARVWDAMTSGKERRWRCSGHEKASLRSDVFRLTGSSVLTASEDKTVRSWEVEPGKESPILPSPTDFITSALFSDDRRRVVTLSEDKMVRVRDTETWKELVVLKDDTKTIFSGSYCPPTGISAVTTSPQGNTRVWDAESGKELTVLKSALGAFRALRDLGRREESGRRAVQSDGGAGVGCHCEQGALRPEGAAHGKYPPRRCFRPTGNGS